MKPHGLLPLLIICFVILPVTAQDTARQPRVDFATYLSGSDNTDITGVAVDSKGYFYVTGLTWASDFPTTAGAFSRPRSRDVSRMVVRHTPVLLPSSAGTEAIWSIRHSSTKQCHKRSR